MPVTGKHVTVEAVVRHIQCCADEPLHKRQIPFAERVPVSRPCHKLFGVPRPIRLVILTALLVERPVGNVG
jgi:hypothetical protein